MFQISIQPAGYDFGVFFSIEGQHRSLIALTTTFNSAAQLSTIFNFLFTAESVGDQIIAETEFPFKA